jgi:hypothetical protein
VSASDKLVKMARNIVAYLSQLRTSYPMFTFENIHLSGKTLKKIRRIVVPKIAELNSLVADVINEGIKSGEFRTVNTRAAAFCFLSAIRMTIFGKNMLPDTEYRVEDILELYFDGLRKRR